MKIDCVLTACNMNKLYYGFIPIFISAWNKLMPEIDVKIILINDTLPDDLIQYKNNIILFKPLENMSTAFISQYIRILYPALLNYENGILITDMDMMPMNRSYYIDSIKEYDNDKFIYYRHILRCKEPQFAICYNVACSNTWGEIFEINNMTDLEENLRVAYKNIVYDNKHGGKGWSTDQINLYDTVMKWNNEKNNLIILNDRKCGYMRLDRISNITLTPQICNMIKTEKFSDYHMLRPYEQHKSKNDAILSILPDYTKK